MSIYGVSTWAMSTYEARRGLISNYIRPIIGDDRQLNAERMEVDFYSGHTSTEEVQTATAVPETTADISDQALLLKLLEKPEMAKLLKALAENL